MILGNRSNQTTITNEFDAINYNISVESCGYVDMFVEATEELAALESAMYVADVMLEEHVLEGATNVEVLLEGVMSGMFTRLKEAVQKLWAKIKQWFANVKKYFQMLFTHGKDFVKKYKTDIIKAEARCKGFKYNFYPLTGGKTKENASASLDAFKTAQGLVKEGESNADIIKGYMKQHHWNGEDSQTEFNKAYRETLYGSDTREEYEDFSSGPSVQFMIKALETGADEVKAIEAVEKVLNSSCSKLIAELQKKENESAKTIAAEGGSLDKAYSLAVELVKAESNHCLAVCDGQKEKVKTIMKDSESVLKRLITHKPKKEGFDGEGLEGHESILEAALKFI